jgi:hypothetical protein
MRGREVSRKHHCGDKAKDSWCHFSRCYRLFTLPRELCNNALVYRNVEYALENARYPSSSLTNQSIASSRVSNLKNSRWEKVFSAW